MQIRILVYWTVVSTVSFAASSHRVSEGTGTLTVTINRSGNTEILATVLVVTDNFQGTAAGNSLTIMVTMT